MRHIEGMTTRQMLRADGLGDAAIDGKLARGELRTTDRGTYRMEGVPDDRRRQLIGALLTVGGPVAVTDLDGLWVAGRVEEPTGPVQLLLPHPRNPVQPRLSRIRSTTRFDHCGLTRTGVIPRVSEAWAITDAAKTRSRWAFARLVTAGVAERWVSLAQIQLVLDIRGRFPACDKVRRLLEELGDDVPYSGTERRLAKRVRTAGMAVELNRTIRDISGAAVAIGDLVLDEERIIIEVDGPHHWLPAVAAADRVRDRVLQSLGWTVIRFTVYEIDADIDAVVREIEASVRARRLAA